ncbi:helix-turn-helix domain-containing protein, partial [bacterium]|nr:helix-turn-helix domain-containing protein [bacterium]MBU1025562.1 helix-turn-helix domain-containing protein [bacterium]
MSMEQTKPINQEILKWARLAQGLSIEDVAKKMNRKRITVETVIAWENGSESPS